MSHNREECQGCLGEDKPCTACDMAHEGCFAEDCNNVACSTLSCPNCGDHSYSCVVHHVENLAKVQACTCERVDEAMFQQYGVKPRGG